METLFTYVVDLSIAASDKVVANRKIIYNIQYTITGCEMKATNNNNNNNKHKILIQQISQTVYTFEYRCDCSNI